MTIWSLDRSVLENFEIHTRTDYEWDSGATYLICKTCYHKCLHSRLAICYEWEISYYDLDDIMEQAIDHWADKHEGGEDE